MAKKAKKPAMFCVTKLDRDNADFYKVLEQLKTVFGPSVCPVVVPVYESRDVVGYYQLDRNEGICLQWQRRGERSPDAGDRPPRRRPDHAISEAVAEADEELFEKYFSRRTVYGGRNFKRNQKGIKAGAITPVVCCSSFTLAGVDMVLDMICELMPSPKEVEDEICTDLDGNPVEVVCADDQPLAAFVFKTIADPFVGKMSYVKVLSGKLTADQTPVNTTTGQPERLGKIVFVKGKKQEDTAQIGAGDIGAVTKLAGTNTGDVLCDPARLLKCEPGIPSLPACPSRLSQRLRGTKEKLPRLCSV